MKDLARHLSRVGIRRKEETPPKPPPGTLDSWDPPRRQVEIPVEAEVMAPARVTPGRPPKGKRKREVHLAMYATPAEAQRIKRIMTRHNLGSISDALRFLVLKGIESC
jgi:hypothetical protein